MLPEHSLITALTALLKSSQSLNSLLAPLHSMFLRGKEVAYAYSVPIACHREGAQEMFIKDVKNINLGARTPSSLGSCLMDPALFRFFLL